MALHQTTHTRRALYQDVLRVVLIAAAIIALMLVATAVLGVQLTGPGYDIVPDPAGIGLP
jgi:hypothetical protein